MPLCHEPDGYSRPVSASNVIAEYERTGRRFTAAGVGSFVIEAGAGEPVVCMHGVPASAYLYRKVVPALGRRGVRGIAFDLPGLGLADRPEAFDYTWTGLGRWATAAVDELGLDGFHLVVHDIGGPVGFEVAAALPERIRSLTILNTLVRVEGFKRPWSMEPFAHRGIGRIYLASVQKPVMRVLMAMQGIENTKVVPGEEIDAYVSLLKRGDHGKAFLSIMRGFERTAEKQRLYLDVVGSDNCPVQVVWGDRDPALKVDVQGEEAREATGLEAIVRLPGKHFLQEDQAEPLAEQIARFVEAAAR
jgi:pimeloyl-ACP methyl ester carboxylesterase